MGSRLFSQCFRPALAIVGTALTVGLFGSGAAASPSPSTARQATSTSIVGEWLITGGTEGQGVFQFIKSGPNAYTDLVIQKRSAVLCPSVNDKSRQIVLRETSPGIYEGTWEWFLTSCASAGLGSTTVTISASGSTATLVTDSPAGLGFAPEDYTLTRLPLAVGPAAARSIIGEWSITGGSEGPGVFQFIKSGSNTYTDLVVKKRSAALCPSVNDKNGQIVLHETLPGLYEGTWKWFFTSCALAGLGPTAVVVSASGSTATLVTDTPAGLGYPPEYYNLARLKDGHT